MQNLDTKYLRKFVSRYTEKSTLHALLIFAGDLLVYSGAITGVILLDSIYASILCSIIAGVTISSLFVIGHDAAHDAYTEHRLLNKVIARVAFFPSLHNYSLWLTEHNRIHHQTTNVYGHDSWSPYSKSDYEKLPLWRKKLEVFYRSVFGIGFYYLIERWWKNKFYPFEAIIGKYKSVYRDFALVMIYLVLYLALLVYCGNRVEHANVTELIILGFIVPFMIWNFMMGFTVYQHHTHETIPWARSKKEREEMGGQAQFTMHVQFPRWYNLLSHNIMEHTAHHVDPRIPLYHLDKAQEELRRIMGDKMRVTRFSFRNFLRTLNKCKLYDYDNHQWLDFDANPVSKPLTHREYMYTRAA